MITNWMIPLAEPELGEEEITAATDVIRSGWLSMGPKTIEFETEFAKVHGVRHAFAVNNCTAALHLAAIALNLGPGDEVICPALTFVATANGMRYTGASVVFADVVSESDLTVDPEDIRRRITPRTKALVVVHYGGYPCLMDEIMAIAHAHGLHVIEDCAHSPLAWIPGANATRLRVGSIGDIGCFSFFGNKNLTTGEGGMVTTNDDQIAERIRLYRSHGMTTLSYDRHKGHASTYDVVGLGYNYRINDVSAAIGLIQLQKGERINSARRDVVRMYRELFADCDTALMPFLNRDLEHSACHIMPVIVPDREQQVRDRLQEMRIQTSKHYQLVPSFSTYRHVPFETRYPAINSIVTLPLFPRMTRDQVALIRGAFDH